MTEGMPRVLSAGEMREWDDRAIRALGVLESVLMEAAGRAAATVLCRHFPRGRVVAAIGRGNNGGDAVVMLRTLRAWGREVSAVPVEGAELPVRLLHGWQIPTAEGIEQSGAEVLVDGLLGTGATGAPRDPYSRLIEALNGSGRPVVSLDGPSGVDLTTGAVEGAAVHAAVSIAFGALKRGLLLFPGRARAGRIVVVEVGFPPIHDAGAELIVDRWARAHYPRLAADAHKGRAGTLAVVAGHPGMGGAAILLAMGALRAGAGKVRMIAPESNRIAIQGAVPESLFVDRAGEAVGEVLESADALAIGPGMGMDEDSRDLLALALRRARGPLLLDADALTLVSQEPSLLGGCSPDRVLLTPHPGEMGRLLGVETGAVTGDPFDAVSRAADRFGCTVLLKGSPSLIAAPGRATRVSVAGHSGIATSGMGDTLAGVIAALMARGSEPGDAAAVGILLAGRAAERVGFDRPVLPRDVADALPATIAATAAEESLPAGVLVDLPRAR